jgi:hypothetical protein
VSRLVCLRGRFVDPHGIGEGGRRTHPHLVDVVGRHINRGQTGEPVGVSVDQVRPPGRRTAVQITTMILSSTHLSGLVGGYLARRPRVGHRNVWFCPCPQALRCSLMSVRGAVFISHSARSEVAARWVMEFAEALRSPPGDLVPLYDRDFVDVGERWREKIFWMLFECEAAVILLTPEALTRPWVLKEATILEARSRRDRDFPLVPVLLGGVTRETLEGDTDWQLVQLPELQVPPATDPAAVAEMVRTVLAPRLARLDSPTRRLAVQIAAYLRETTRDQLRGVLNALDETLPPHLVDELDGWARAIAQWVLRLPPPSLNRVAEALLELGDAFPNAQAEGILELARSTM